MTVYTIDFLYEDFVTEEGGGQKILVLIDIISEQLLCKIYYKLYYENEQYL